MPFSFLPHRLPAPKKPVRSSGLRSRALALTLPLALTLAGLSLLNTPALAQAGSDCVPGGTVAQTNACAIKSFQETDTEMQILYADVMRALSAHERPDLRRDQTDWTRQRNQRCKQAEAAHEAQPDWPRRYHECLSRLTREREAGLKHWLNAGGPPP